MDLTALFGRFVGQHVKDPARMTCDCDPVADEIGQTARAAGLSVIFDKAGSAPKAAPGPWMPGNAVHAHIKRADKHGSRWTVTGFSWD